MSYKPADLAAHPRGQSILVLQDTDSIPILSEIIWFDYSVNIFENERKNEKCLLLKITVCNFTEKQE